MISDLYDRPLLNIDGYTEPENSLTPELTLYTETMIPRRDTPFSSRLEEETAPVRNHQIVKATTDIEDLTVTIAKSFLVTNPVQEPPKTHISIFGIPNTITPRIPGLGPLSLRVYKGNVPAFMRNANTSPSSPFRNLKALIPPPWMTMSKPHRPLWIPKCNNKLPTHSLLDYDSNFFSPSTVEEDVEDTPPLFNHDLGIIAARRRRNIFLYKGPWYEYMGLAYSSKGGVRNMKKVVAFEELKFGKKLMRGE